VDTDADGWSDGEEVEQGTDPSVADAFVDSLGPDPDDGNGERPRRPRARSFPASVSLDFDGAGGCNGLPSPPTARWALLLALLLAVLRRRRSGSAAPSA
jgi:hypothetical protein